MNPNQLMLVSDMDDTLFDSRKHISDRNRNAIWEFQKKGGLFTVATGRSVIGLRPYQQMINIQMPVILYNGSCIYDYQKRPMVWVKKLPECIKAYVKELALEFPNLGIQIMTESGIYTCRPTPIYMQFVKRESLPYTEVPEPEEFPGNWIKAELTTDLMNPEALDACLEATMPEGCRWLATGVYSREIVASEVSKGSAVLRYRKLFGLSDRKLCCIGDHNNDYEMIQAADVGFAVGNALECIKDKADFIVSDNDHDAVAEAIEHMEQL